jgi:hypothetical protein
LDRSRVGALVLDSESVATLPPFIPIEGQKSKSKARGKEAVDRNGRFQIQGGKKLDFTEINQGKQILLGLSLVGNLVKPLLSLYRNEWRERGY